MSETLDRLVGELSKLPGVGRKTAQRLALHFLKEDRASASALAAATMSGIKGAPFVLAAFLSDARAALTAP